MDLVYAIACFVVILAVAILLGRMNHEKHPVAFTFAWIGSILLLLSMRFWNDHPFERALFVLLVLVRILGHIPSWVFWTLGGGVVLFLTWYLFNLMGNAFIELTWELKETNARISKLDSKIDDITSRLPESD